jgi:hypothetical protein
MLPKMVRGGVVPAPRLSCGRAIPLLQGQARSREDVRDRLLFEGFHRSTAAPLSLPYYLEADSLLWATNEMKFYSLLSPCPLYTYSDHLLLAWMRKSEKGPVFQFLVNAALRTVGHRAPVHSSVKDKKERDLKRVLLPLDR